MAWERMIDLPELRGGAIAASDSTLALPEGPCTIEARVDGDVLAGRSVSSAIELGIEFSRDYGLSWPEWVRTTFYGGAMPPRPRGMLGPQDHHRRLQRSTIGTVGAQVRVVVRGIGKKAVPVVVDVEVR